jgi:hypothetical protein
MSRSMQKALVGAGVVQPRTGHVTPQSPSRSATARVKNPLPAPTICPHCSGAVELVNNSEIYGGRSYGEWPWAYKCAGDGCDSYVGLHPFTGIPLGTLADAATRAARKAAKDAFNPLWQRWGARSMTRTEAYAWLAGKLGIADVNTCHVGWFDVETCARVVAVCRVQP